MLDFIRNILGIKDEPNLFIYDFKRIGSRWYIYVEYRLVRYMHCPACGSVMHVKDVYERTIKNSVLLTDTQIIIKYRQRSWYCRECHTRFTPVVSFVHKWKQHTTLSMKTGVIKLQDLSRSVSSVARDMNISDTSLHNWFMQYVDIKRLQMPSVLSIDEVYTNFRADCKYTLVLMDFDTKKIVDLVPSRRERYTGSYFLSIPVEERRNVKVIISDMYQPYIDYADRYFPEAVVAVDSFHVIAFLNALYNTYLNELARRYKNILAEDPGSQKASDNYYLLKNMRWILLENDMHIRIIENPRRADKHFGYHMSTYAYKEKFYAISDRLVLLNEAKERYVRFNDRTDYKDRDEIEKCLMELIAYYRGTGDGILVKFAGMLELHAQYVVNSFVVLEDGGVRRLSNGPMESFNRKPKDLKRLARGVENFEFFRQRMLFNDRNDIDLPEEPKKFSEIQNKTNRRRGYYRQDK